MYKLLLISKYLRRKLAPMFAALAVTLCTAMVIIVISVMGGFLNMLRTSTHHLSGDVIIMGGGYDGFPYYGELIKKLDASPAILAATPVIHTYGLIKLEGTTIPVTVQGIRPEQLNQVVAYKKTLHWSKADYLKQLESDYPPPTERSATDKKLFAKQKKQIERMDLKAFAMHLNRPVNEGNSGKDEHQNGKTTKPAPIVLGIAVANVRDNQGHYHFRTSAVGMRAILTVMPVAQTGMPSNPTLHRMLVVNEFKSGVYEVDQKRVYVGFNLLQKMMFMSPAPVANLQTGEPTGQMTQGRTNEVLVKGAKGFSEAQIDAAAKAAVSAIEAEHVDMPPLDTMTWQQRYSTILGAVENEKGLVTFLFVIISIVAVVMVATTFYMTVLEKTRDIGVLRALGASRMGIMSLFLGYGLAIGIIGALLGLGLAWAIVAHLNQIQAIIRDLTGWQMWNPKIYVFDHIPDQVLWFSATVIAIGAVISSVIGSLIPAILAAMLNPVEALGHE